METNMGKVGFLGSFLTVFGLMTLNAQTSILERSASYYASLKSFSVQVSLAMYTDEKAKTPSRTMKGFTKVSGLNSLTSFDGREVINGKDFVLVADHPNQTVYYSPREKTKQEPVNTGAELLEKRFTSMYNVVKIAGDEQSVTMKMTPKKANSEFNYLTIKFGQKIPVIQEIVYVYSGNVKYKKTLIRYSGFNPDWIAGKNDFSEAAFIKGKNKSASLVPAFSHYKLINSFNYDPKKDLIIE